MTPDKIPGFNIALDVITGIAVIIGFLVIFQSMYTAVLERTREIGILKSMGASKADHRGRGAARVRRSGRSRGCGRALRAPMECASDVPVFPTQHFEITVVWLGAGLVRSPSWGQFAARSIRPGWPPAKIPSTRWLTSRRDVGGTKG